MTAIANCRLDGAVIVEEWLATNHLARMRQLGLGPCAGPAADAGVRDGELAEPAVGPRHEGPGAIVADFISAFERRDLDAALVHCLPDIRRRIGPDLILDGPAGIRRSLQEWHERLAGLRVRIADRYWTEQDGIQHVATQAIVSGERHGRSVSCLVIAHHHVRDGYIAAAWIEVDELALLHLIEGVKRS